MHYSDSVSRMLEREWSGVGIHRKKQKTITQTEDQCHRECRFADQSAKSGVELSHTLTSGATARPNTESHGLTSRLQPKLPDVVVVAAAAAAAMLRDRDLLRNEPRCV